MNNKELIDFLIDTKETLIDTVSDQLNLEGCDSELCCIKDNVSGKIYYVLIEDIINKTRELIINAIETF